MNYTEHDDVLGATVHWHNSCIIHSEMTVRGTCVEFIYRPQWGIACYMNGTIQSCLADEKIYHAALVGDISGQCDVCIFGGGEGATARNCLAFSNVRSAHMVEWDQDVIQLFTDKFPQWANNAWNDTRLTVICDDAFDYSKQTSHKYNYVIVDLFEPDEQTPEKWGELFNNIRNILVPGGIVRMYAGMYDFFDNGEAQQSIMRILERCQFMNIQLTRTFIPSFLGEACFLSANI